MKRLLCLMVVGALVLSIFGVLSPISAKSSPEVMGPYIDEITFKLETDRAKALRLIEAGEELQGYLYGMEKPDNKDYAYDSEDIRVVSGYGSIRNLFFNPLEWGHFNPFAIREVREAMNWLIDRDFIVNEICGGRAIPMTVTYHPLSPDYARSAAFMSKLEDEYSYDLERAEDTITEAMNDSGATKTDGKWMFDGEPITIDAWIRTGDLRKDIGEYVANLLEDQGFTVERHYGDMTVAVNNVFGATEGWNFYTGGWAFTAISPYADSWPHYFYRAAWSGAVFKEKTRPPRFETLIDGLRNAEYGKNMTLRQEWIAESAEWMLRDSTRLWLTIEEAVFPFHKSVSNVTKDLWGGPWHLFSLRSARIGGEVGGSLIVGMPHILSEGFNPIGGFKTLYDSLPERLMFDVGVYPHPHHGRYIPVRADFVVESLGPEENLSVPKDTLKYDLDTDKFVEVGPGVRAMSRVTFNLTWGNWHHGAEVTINDYLASIAEIFKVGNSASPLFDEPSVTPGMMTYMEKFRGIREIDEDTIEIYIDYFHPDETYIAAYASTWPSVPWEVNALMNGVVLDQELAFSSDTATDWGVDQLCLARGDSISILNAKYGELSDANYIPKFLEERVTSADASARWSSLGDWYNDKGHFLVANGPYYLDKVDPDAMTVTVKAARDTYPYSPEFWDRFTVPVIPELSLTEIPEVVVEGESVRFVMNTTFAGEPYEKVTVDYFVLDPATGETVLTGKAEQVTPGTFVVNLTPEESSRLVPGPYEVMFVALGEEAALPKITRKAIVAASAVGMEYKALYEKYKVMYEELAIEYEELTAGYENLTVAVGDIVDVLGAYNKTLGAYGEKLDTYGEQLDGLATSDTNIKMSINELEKGTEDTKKDVKAVESDVRGVFPILAIAIIIAVVGIVIGGISLYKARKAR